MTHHSSRTLPKRNTRFRHFLAASTVSLLGSNVFDIAIPLYVLARTGSVIDLGLVTSAVHLPHLLMAPFTGYFSDHNRKRASLVLADLGQVFLLGLLSLYIWSGAAPLWPIFALVFFIKTLMLTFETVSQFQLIPGLVGPLDLTGANTWFLSLHRVIQIVGPATAGFLLDYVGVQSCILINILSFAATLHFSWSFKKMDQLLGTVGKQTLHSTGEVAKQFRHSLKFIWNSPVFHPFILLMLLWNLSPMTLNSPTLLYYFTVTNHYTSFDYGILMSLVGVLGIIGFLTSHVLYRDKRFDSVFEGSSVVQAVFGTLCVFPLSMPLLFGFLYGVSRASSSVLSAGAYLLRQTRVPRAQSGAINASLRMFFMAAAPLSSVFQGWMIDRYGVGSSLIFGAVCLWGTWWYSRKLAFAYREEEQLLKPYVASPFKRHRA